MKMDRDAFLILLVDTEQRILSGDSLEGRIAWEAQPAKDAAEPQFEIEATIRIGNLDGQGRVRIIEPSPEEKEFKTILSSARRRLNRFGAYHSLLETCFDTVLKLVQSDGLDDFRGDTTGAIGEALGFLARARALVGRDIDDLPMEGS